MTITGTNFSVAGGVSAVDFGGSAASSFTVDSATQIMATSPSESAGTVNVTVTTVGGTSATSGGDQFTYTAAPTVTGISPSAGPTTGSTSVTVTGTNFTGASAVKFGTFNAVSFTVNSSTQITATSITGSAGTVNVTVTTPGGTSATSGSDQFTYETPTTTTLTSSPNASDYGQSVTLTATVTTGVGSPTGTVEFLDGATVLGTGTLSLVSGSEEATYSTSALLAGDHPSMTAVYEGNGSFYTSTSSDHDQYVDQDNTATSLSASPTSSAYGQGVTLTATVAASSPGSGTPTGSVTFYDGATSLGSASLSSGTATLNTTALSVANHTDITAVYGGDSNFVTSTSSAASVDVSQDGSTTTLTSSANPSTSGASVTFTATVTANSPGSGTPTGTVQFLVGGVDYGSPVSLSAGAASTSDSGLSLGYHTITAVYSGDTNFTASNDTASPLSQEVIPLVTLTNPGTETNSEGDTVDLALSATDSASNALEYTATNLPQGLVLNYVTGVISGTIWSGASLSGPYSVTVTATDSVVSASYASQTFTWNVNPVVTLANPGETTNADGDTVYVPLAAADSAGNALTYSATGLPAGLSISSSTGIISGSVSSGDDADSPYSVSVSATDSVDTGVSASQTFAWTINATGTITVSLTSPGTRTNFEGDTVDLALSASDSASNALVYGAVNLPPGLTINSSTGAITGTVDAFDSASSPYTVIVSATDSTNPSVGAYQTFTWNVNPVVTLTNPGAETNADSDTVYLPLTATDSADNALTFSATGLPAGLSINSTTGAISGIVSSGDDADGPYSITVTATDSVDTSISASQTFAWTINPTGTITVSLTQPANQTNFEGDSVDLALSASDSADNALVYAAANLPPGLSINASTGVISGTVAVGDSTNGPYTVTVSARDSTNPSVGASQTFTWNVNPLVTLAAPDSASNANGDTVYLPLDAADSAENPLTFTATNLPPGLSINPNTGAISGTVSAGADTDSPYTVTVTATDTVSGVDASESFQWTISASGTITVSLAQPGNQDNLEGDTVDLELTATDSADNAVTYQASNLPAGLSIDASTGVISGTVDDDDSLGGAYTVTVSATDGDNFTVGASQTFQWTIAPVVILTNPGSQSNVDGDTVFLPLSATDSSGDLDFTATNLPAGLSIDPSTGAISGNVAAEADVYSPYTVTVTATDAASGTSASQTFEWTVNSTGTLTVSLAQPAEQSSVEGDNVDLALSATDSASNALVYQAYNLPAGLSINASTGVISGTVDDGDSLAGTYTVTVSATDSTNASVGSMQTFTWNVIPQVTLANPGSLSNADGDAVELSVAATDSAGLPVTFAATNLPPGLTINPSTGIISGTVSAGADAGSPYSVTVTATDLYYTAAAGTVTFAWTITATGTVTVSFTQTPDQSNADGDTVNLTVSATDSAAHTLSYAALNLPAGLSINSATGVISGTITAGGYASSPYTVTVIASDANNPSVGSTETFQWTVSPTVGLDLPDLVSESNGQQVNWAFASNNTNLAGPALAGRMGLNIFGREILDAGQTELLDDPNPLREVWTFTGPVGLTQWIIAINGPSVSFQGVAFGVRGLIVTFGLFPNEYEQLKLDFNLHTRTQRLNLVLELIKVRFGDLRNE